MQQGNGCHWGKYPPKEIRNEKNKLKCPYIINGVPSYFNV
jgi:hypothetical protein